MKKMEYYNSFRYKVSKPFKRAWFKFLLNRNKMITVGESHRGIGKTYMMIERAMKEDIAIVVGTQQSADNIKRHGNPVDVVRLAPNFTLDLEVSVFPNGVMIDETVDPKMIVVLESKNIEIRGGFIADYGGDVVEG